MTKLVIKDEPPPFIPPFMLKRVLPEPEMWKPRPAFVPEPEVERRPISGAKKK